jgi:hypothetical protein
MCVIIYLTQRVEDFIPHYPQPPRVVQSNKVYLSQEALLVSFSLVSRPINAIR